VDEPATLFVIVAVKVIVPASTGLEGDVETAIVGVPLDTTIFWAVVAGSEAYVASPL
jgi:hypothetical protein